MHSSYNDFVTATVLNSNLLSLLEEKFYPKIQTESFDSYCNRIFLNLIYKIGGK